LKAAMPPATISRIRLLFSMGRSTWPAGYHNSWLAKV
jgi:hypothetical protein